MVRHVNLLPDTVMAPVLLEIEKGRPIPTSAYVKVGLSASVQVTVPTVVPEADPSAIVKE